MNDVTQPSNTPVTRADPDDNKAARYGQFAGGLQELFVKGVPWYVRMRKSLRVGSGTGLASQDGNDGTIIASGTLAALIAGDRATPSNGNYIALLLNGTTASLGTQAGNLWTWDTTTGVSPQPAWTNFTLANLWVAGGGSAFGYRRNNLGKMELRGVIANGTFGVSPISGTLPVGFRPPVNTKIVMYGGQSAGAPVYAPGFITVSTGGAITIFGVPGYNVACYFDGVSFDID